MDISNQILNVEKIYKISKYRYINTNNFEIDYFYTSIIEYRFTFEY